MGSNLKILNVFSNKDSQICFSNILVNVQLCRILVPGCVGNKWFVIYFIPQSYFNFFEMVCCCFQNKKSVDFDDILYNLDVTFLFLHLPLL